MSPLRAAASTAAKAACWSPAGPEMNRRSAPAFRASTAASGTEYDDVTAGSARSSVIATPWKRSSRRRRSVTIARAQLLEVEADGGGAQLRRLVRRPEPREVLDRPEQPLLAEGADHDPCVSGDLLRIVAVDAGAQGRPGLEADVDHGAEEAGDVEVAHGAGGLERLGGGVLRRRQVGARQRGRQSLELVELAAVLGGEHPRRHMALVPGDDPRLGAQLPEEGGVAGVVPAGEDDAAEVLVAQAAVDLGREVGALETEQEEVGG